MNAVGATRRCTTCSDHQECIIGDFWVCPHCDRQRKTPEPIYNKARTSHLAPVLWFVTGESHRKSFTIGQPPPGTFVICTRRDSADACIQKIKDVYNGVGIPVTLVGLDSVGNVAVVQDWSPTP